MAANRIAVVWFGSHAKNTIKHEITGSKTSIPVDLSIKPFPSTGK